MAALETLLGVVILFLLLGALVFLHELGHFLAAKAIGVQVSVFSVGFGKRLFSFTRGGTEFRLSLIPAGGYVRFAEAEPENEYDDFEETVLDREPPKRRIFVYAAGPAVNILAAVLLFTAVAAGGVLQPDIEPVVGAVDVNAPLRSSYWDDPNYASPAAQAGVQPGDRILAVNGRKVRAWADVQKKLTLKPDRPAVVEAERRGERLMFEITPPPGLREAMHVEQVGLRPLSAFAEEGFLPGSGSGYVEALTASKSFAAAGVKEGSRLMKIDGAPIRSLEDARAALLKALGSRSVRMVFETDGTTQTVETNPSRHLTVTVAAADAERNPSLSSVRVGDRLKSADGVSASYYSRVRAAVMEKTAASEPLRTTFTRSASFLTRGRAWIAHRALKAVGKETDSACGCCVSSALLPSIADGNAQIEGLTLRSNLAESSSDLRMDGLALTERAAPNERYGWFGSFRKGASMTVESAGDVLSILKPLLSGDEITLARLNGKALTVNSVAESVVSGGLSWTALFFALYLTAWVSVELAVLNLIPIPVLDGGRIFLDTVELARKRPLSRKLRAHLLLLGLFILIGSYAYIMLRQSVAAVLIGVAVGFGFVFLKKFLKKASARRAKMSV